MEVYGGMGIHIFQLMVIHLAVTLAKYKKNRFHTFKFQKVKSTKTLPQ